MSVVVGMLLLDAAISIACADGRWRAGDPLVLANSLGPRGARAAHEGEGRVAGGADWLLYSIFIAATHTIIIIVIIRRRKYF